LTLVKGIQWTSIDYSTFLYYLICQHISKWIEKCLEITWKIASLHVKLTQNLSACWKNCKDNLNMKKSSSSSKIFRLDLQKLNYKYENWKLFITTNLNGVIFYLVRSDSDFVYYCLSLIKSLISTKNLLSAF